MYTLSDTRNNSCVFPASVVRDEALTVSVIQDTTGPLEDGMSCWRQGVVLLPEPVQVRGQSEQTGQADGAAHELRIQASFDGATGDVALGEISFN